MAMTLVNSIAYGSNLHPVRLAQRVRSAKPVGVVPMPGKRLAFHKKSQDGSGKCLFYDSARTDDIMYGVIYQFDSLEKKALDDLEGLGKGYNEQMAVFPFNGETYRSYIYVATSTHIDATLIPYDWYKEMVLLGARYHGLPTEYIAKITAVASVPDPDPKRAAKNEALLVSMRHINAVEGR